MKVSDFRSDTVTRPCEDMRKAMASAEVGDDVFGDDPTVQKLEKMSAQLFEKEAALFLPSGTMANQIACFCHTQPGDEVILEAFSHIYNFEVAALAVISRVQARPLESERGILSPEKVEKSIRPQNLHVPRTSLLCVENTHNMHGGRVIPFENLQRLYKITREHEMALHLDGARIFNASYASGIPVSQYASLADSVSFCLSKGLGAPVGSILVSTKEFIQRARKIRKMLGGGMRQAGVLAACGIVALEKRELLIRDHERAKKLGAGLASLSSFHVVQPVETNIVMVDLDSNLPASKVVEAFQKEGIWIVAVSPYRIRLVTHRDVDDQDVERCIEVAKKLYG
ncbi:MAG: low-specificity L-threonine aldolase [Planctomycetota bacterium]|nr:MAG: low-specificity L-threonine aldolase [Planctomycetota bacterium]